MTQFLSYTFSEIKGEVDTLVALLSQFEFQSFEERDHSMIAYITEDDAQAIEAEDLSHIQSIVDFKLEIEQVENKNWNAEWEASFQPIFMDDFCCIRADFHQLDHDCDYDIIVNPKMAFGTGHHETTYMMMSAMRYLDIKDKSVFDYGCGTGVLAILAEKLCARKVYAIDYDIESVNNTKENIEVNVCNKIVVEHKEIKDISTDTYDLILANINRHVLLEQGYALKSRCTGKGILLLSGILQQDEEIVMQYYNEVGFTLIEKNQKGDWLCLKLMLS